MIIKSLSSSQIALIIKTGRAYNSGSFVLKTPVRNEELEKDEFFGAFIVSKKVFSKAVDRNKAKRRIREAFKEAVKGVKKEKLTPASFVFLIKKGVVKTPFAEIVQETKQILVKDYIIKQ